MPSHASSPNHRRRHRSRERLPTGRFYALLIAALIVVICLMALIDGALVHGGS